MEQGLWQLWASTGLYNFTLGQVVMIAVGGMTEFAAGNKSVLVRLENGQQNSYGLRLDDLLKDGDISANMAMMPGDIVIISEAWF